MLEPQPGDIIAPDGIIIRPIDGAGSSLVSVVVGVIPPRVEDYPVHFHYALEQVTYVLRGRVTALFRGPGDVAPSEVVLEPGRPVTTPPATTLSFRNTGPDVAEVLFICVPAYPASNADTEVVGEEHRPLSSDELRRAVRRHRRARAHLRSVLQARVDALRWLEPSGEPGEGNGA